ncbi:MAG: alpha/beta fold hydrolase [Acidobacteriota bacterium]|nr:alpha/beta fold hydrolase [Acidobacteriota bacterium]
MCSRPGILFILTMIACSHAAFAQTQIAPPGVVHEEPPFRKRIHTGKMGAKMPYRLFVPPKYDSTKKYPLILWFHGGSGRGSNNEAQILGENEKGAHLWTTAENQAAFPAFVLAPQCALGENWSDPELNEISAPLQLALDILALVQKDYSIDRNRIYLVGQSMGGLGVWSLLQKYPEQWAAAVLVASYDNFTNVAAITRVPLWIFQWEMDPAVPVDLVRQMVKEIKKAGGHPHYTEYRKVKNEAWNNAFVEPELVPWLAAQKKTAQTEDAGK